MDENRLNQLARIAFDAFYAEGTPYTGVEAAMFCQVVSAVLTCIFERGWVVSAPRSAAEVSG